ncbi:MAG: ribonuclease III, partial [Clostridiales bacterium]|nr:ribonuclease III [Clostridiales bacterium]
LQEIVQAQYEDDVQYVLVKEEGPDHNKSFEVCAKIGDEEVGRGAGRTKKAAEQVAAYNGILKLKAQEAAAEE